MSAQIQEKELSLESTRQINELQLEVFKEKVKDWMAADDDIRILNGHLKERKKIKNALTPEILQFMNEHEIKNMKSGQVNLKYTETIVKKPMNKDYIRKKLMDFLKNNQVAEDATNYITENRDTMVKTKLKRINNNK